MSEIPSWALINFAEIDLGDRIGGGGVGVIYRGYWGRQQVALKTLFDPRISEELKKEYMDELLVMSKVKHSNIVTFMGACMTPPNLCFVMEICECSLDQILHVDRTRPSDHDSIQMAIDVASAMEYLHSGCRPTMIHRDLKPLNILKAYNGSMKLCDFGLVNCKNSQAGTPSYMAPELYLNRPYNKSVDVYAFGIVLWEIISKVRPFLGLSVPEIRDRVVNGERPSLRELHCSRRCLDLIESCWRGEVEERPDFTFIVDELIAISDNISVASHTANLSTVRGGDALDDLITPRK